MSMAKSKTRTWLAFGPALAAAVLAACGEGRSYDNPPEVPVGTASSTTRPAPTAPTTTAFVPSTAPTTLAPPTNPPTAPPTNAPPPQTPAPTNAPPPPTEPVPTTGERYAVVQGDTLSGISTRLGVSLTQLLAANGLDENSLIVPGQQLDVPLGGAVPAPTQPPTNPPTAPPTNAPPPQTPAPTNAPPPTEPPPGQSPGPPSGQPPGQPPGPPSRPTTTVASPPGAVQPRETAASCQAPDSEEADGTPIVFAPGNVLDRNPATAWRCEAGSEQTLTFTLDGETHLTSVGLIGGYVKVDPTTEVDRFEQNHRVRRVSWTFSDGTTVTQDLDDSRQMQTIAVNVTTTSVTLEILDTYLPGGDFPRDMVPVAEVQLVSG
jgi:LysM repeat protein